MKYKKKLIEVAIPLFNINSESIKERNIRHGHPSTLLRYWARRPLASAAGIILSNLIDDPSNDMTLSEEEVIVKRKQIFSLISNYIKWTNRDNDELHKQIAILLKESCDLDRISILDPFAGGGSIPLEVQRLGIKSIATDLNPVSVIINKAMIDLPFNYKPNKNISIKNFIFNQSSISQLADDVEFYANELINNTYQILKPYYIDYNNEKVIGWIYAKEVSCLNPSCRKTTPALKSFNIVSKKDRSFTLVPKITGNSIHFELSNEKNVERTGNLQKGNIFCLFCNQPSRVDDVNNIKKISTCRERVVCVITEGNRTRNYHSVNDSYEIPYIEDDVFWGSDLLMPVKALGINLYKYGFANHGSLYNKRQKLFFKILIDEIKKIDKNLQTLEDKEDYGQSEYVISSTIVTYLSLLVCRLANQNSRLTRWDSSRESLQGTFMMQALEMRWEYVESNPFSNSTGNISNALNWIINVIKKIHPRAEGVVLQRDAKAKFIESNPIIITDPPYYDNVGYADLSDYYYLFMKGILSEHYKDIFNTISTPKQDELVANPHRHGSKDLAELHFLNGMEKVAKNIYENSNSDYPVVYYYAFKQNESSFGGESSTGWETFLLGLINSGFQITATWPIRTEMPNRTRAIKANALASSIIIVLRKKDELNQIATRREFVNTLKSKLENAILAMMESDITPVDLQQSAIGPGMAVFTQYAKVLESDGSAMTVRTALQLINAELDSIQENSDIEMDSDTRFCIQWFDTYGFDEKTYGDAETLAHAKDISVQGLVISGVFIADSGKAKLKHWSKMPSDWDPRTDERLTLWECTHHMVRELIDGDGQLGAAKLAKVMGSQKADEAKELAYQLYHICDKRSWAKYAGDYNTLVSNWADIKSEIPNISEGQETLF
jgi:putative DNA methylase